jgi:cytochrome c553
MKKFLVMGVALTMLATWSARADDAKTNYDAKCAKCHGDDGKGQKAMGKKLGCKDWTDAAVQAKFTDGDATKAITEGFKDADGKTLMKPAEGLADDDVKALVAYIRAFGKK